MKAIRKAARVARKKAHVPVTTLLPAAPLLAPTPTPTPAPARVRGKKGPGAAAVVLDELLAHIRAGGTLHDYARATGIDRASVSDYLFRNPGAMAQVTEARVYAADAYVEEAEDVLRSLPSLATPGDIARARELAHHLRWRAARMRPKLYGDRVDGEVKVTIDPLATLIGEIQQRGSRIPLRGLGEGDVQDVQDGEP